MVPVTTGSIPRRERAEFWADLVSRHVTPMRIEPAGKLALHGEIQARVIGNLGVAQVSGLGVHALHTGAHIARARGHVYAACVHLDGEARISRRGEAIALRRGDIFLTDPSETQRGRNPALHVFRPLLEARTSIGDDTGLRAGKRPGDP